MDLCLRSLQYVISGRMVEWLARCNHWILLFILPTDDDVWHIRDIKLKIFHFYALIETMHCVFLESKRLQIERMQFLVLYYFVKTIYLAFFARKSLYANKHELLPCSRMIRKLWNQVKPQNCIREVKPVCAELSVLTF